MCDGFIGNVALKVSEGIVDVIKHMLKESLQATVTRQIGYLLSRSAYTDLRSVSTTPSSVARRCWE